MRDTALQPTFSTNMYSTSPELPRMTKTPPATVLPTKLFGMLLRRTRDVLSGRTRLSLAAGELLNNTRDG